MSAKERIKGYCCEVTPEQWKELVRVADKVVLPVWSVSRKERDFTDKRYALTTANDAELICTFNTEDRELIPFPDFLAKLRGDAETWTPKAGEMVEVGGGDGEYFLREFIAYRGGWYVCWREDAPSKTIRWRNCRPARPRMTKAEAEAKFNIIITEQ